MANFNPKKPMPAGSHPWRKPVLYAVRDYTAEEFKKMYAEYQGMIERGIRSEKTRYMNFQISSYFARQSQGKNLG